jgi:NADH:ubiquinone oxidoreductase subunit D
MKKKSINIDDSLIISRLQHKELLGSKSDLDFDSLFFPQSTETFIRPFFDNNPIKTGLKIKLIGNNIIHTRIDRGYFHHGVEEELSRFSLPEAISAIGRLHLKAPLFYQLPVFLAAEQLYERPWESKSYAMALEFSRIAHHFNVIKNICYCLKLYSLSDLVNQGCEILAEPFLISERIYQEKDPIEAMPLAKAHQAILDVLSLISDLHHRITQEDKLAILAKKAHIGLRAAASLGLTGPYLRANRCYYDLRHIESSRPLYESPPEWSIVDGGDAWARFSLRLLEIIASLSWLKTYTAKHSSSILEPIKILKPCVGNPKKLYSMASIDSPEGDVKISIFVDGKNNSFIFRVRTPAYFIAQAIPALFHEAKLNDVTLLLNSLGITAEEIDK